MRRLWTALAMDLASPAITGSMPLNPLIGRSSSTTSTRRSSTVRHFDVDHVVIRVQNTLGMRHGKGSECIKCGVVVLWIRQWSDKTKVCRACITRVIKTASSPSQPLVAQSPLHGHIDDAVLDIAFGDDLNRLERRHLQDDEEASKVTTAFTNIQWPRGTQPQPVCATAESHNGKVTPHGDMDKMHLVLSSDNVFILVSDKIRRGQPSLKAESSTK
jgi:hypothetical protein